MMPVRLPIFALLACLLPTLTGCDDGTSTGDGDLGDLDPTTLVVALNNLVAPLDASSTANANLRSAVADLTDAGVEWRAVESAIRERARQRLGFATLTPVGPVPPLPVTFPPEVVGRTFVFDFEAQVWEADDTRTAAPADGIRLIWYTVDGSGRIRFPLDERGHIDLTPGSGAGEAMDITVVETGEGGSLTLLEFVQNRESTAGDVEVDGFTAAGHYANESASSNFEIASEETLDTETDDGTFDLSVILENQETLYTMEVEGTQAGGSGPFEDRFTATVVRGGASTVLNVTFQGTGTTQEESSGTLVRNGTLIANVNIAGNTFNFTTPDGGTFSGAQTNELNTLFSAMTRIGFEVLLNLPLVLP